MSKTDQYPYHAHGCSLRFTKEAIWCTECKGDLAQISIFDIIPANVDLKDDTKVTVESLQKENDLLRYVVDQYKDLLAKEIKKSGEYAALISQLISSR